MLEYVLILSKIEGGYSGLIVVFDDVIGFIDGKVIGFIS